MRIPLATYRLQFSPSFGFQNAKALIPYLSELGISDDSSLQAFAGLPDTFTRLSEMDDSPEKHRQLAEAKGLLARLYSDNPIVNVCIDGVLDSFHRRPEGPVEQSPLYLLLDQQMFKPVFRQTAYEKINYRRFFYLSEFISLRAEDPQVFHRTRDKILELGEFLRTDWPIQGTSGYKFCDYVNAIFCQRENEQACTECRPEVNRVVQLLLSVPEREPESPSRRPGGVFSCDFSSSPGRPCPLGLAGCDHGQYAERIGPGLRRRHSHQLSGSDTRGAALRLNARAVLTPGRRSRSPV